MSQNFYSASSPSSPYFADRRANPYRSTLGLEAFLAKQRFFDTLPPGTLVADVAFVTGSESAYLAARYPHLNSMGVDLEQHLIDAAVDRHADLPNLSFVQGDIYAQSEVDRWGEVRAVWFSQTLSWMKWWQTELRSLLGPSVDRIALSTLAWDGPNESEVIHYLGRKEDPSTKRVSYSVYSIPAMTEFMAEAGFVHQSIEKFEIDVDLVAPSTKELGSYTVTTAGGERLTFTTWQYLPWHFFIFSRTDLKLVSGPPGAASSREFST
jgi:hypothetical protein